MLFLTNRKMWDNVIYTNYPPKCSIDFLQSDVDVPEVHEQFLDSSNFEVKKTTFCGWGLFTNIPIKQGSFISYYTGQYKQFQSESKYQFSLERDFFVDQQPKIMDSKIYGNETRFINHSCNPNCTAISTWVRYQQFEFPTVVFVAKRNITSFEELTIRYCPTEKLDFECCCSHCKIN